MNVWLVGGTKRIPTSVEDAIKGDGYTVQRISGADRYETAAAIAEAGIKLDGKKPAKAFVASGDSFADALVVSPIAFAKHYPIVLTEKDSTPEASKKALGNIGTDTKILVGGKAVVSEGVEKNLTVTQRVSGADRAVTANLVSDWAKSSEGFQKDDAVLVGGKDGFGADSLVAASFAGKAGYTLHFSGWAATETYLKEHANELTGKGFVIGGKGAVAVADVEKAQAAAQTVVSNQSINVTPTDDKTIVLADEAGKTPTDDDRVYSVSGLSSDSKYRVTLVNKDNVTVKDGVVTFVPLAIGGGVYVANPGSLAADITIVNGAPTGADTSRTAANVANTAGDVQSVGGIMPVDGKITFRVDGAADETLVPVVYVDGGKDTRLEVDSKGVPSETFGLGGAINYNPVEAEAGDDLALTTVVDEVDAAAKTFVAGGKSWKWDANDIFMIGGKQATVAQFEKALQAKDTITVDDYQPNTDLKSTFDLTNTTEVKPTISDKGATETSVTLDLADVAKGASVTIYYAIEDATPGLRAYVKADFTAAQVAVDADKDKDGFQAVVSGLKTDTTYAFYATQTTDRGESPVSTGVNQKTTATPGDLSLKSASADDINDGQGTASAIKVTLSGAADYYVSQADATGLIYVSPTSQPDVQIPAQVLSFDGTNKILTVVLYTAEVPGNNGPDGVVGGGDDVAAIPAAGTRLNDATTDVDYTVVVKAGALKDAKGAPNAKVTTSFKY